MIQAVVSVKKKKQERQNKSDNSFLVIITGAKQNKDDAL